MARLSGSQMRLVWLWLTLDELGESPKFETLDDRIVLQKLVYLAQEATDASVYSFNPYIRGPYSPSLTRDLYGLLEPGQMTEAKERAARYKLSAEAIRDLERVSRVANGRGRTPYVVWLELVASLHMKYLEQPGEYDAVWAELTAWKGNIFDKSTAKAAWDSLLDNELVEDH